MRSQAGFTPTLPGRPLSEPRVHWWCVLKNTKVIQQTADIAARVLSGEAADKILLLADIAGLQVRVDWRALQHWHISESTLPAGTLVLYREPTLWERGGNISLQESQ